ncbi:protein neprosin-like [Cicer arietinum]
MNITLFFVFCLVTSSIGHMVHGMHSMLKEDFELERKLMLIKKSPMKSIHTKSGYIVDCVNIKKQPAFDHPLLKNHKLQRKPSSERNISETDVHISPTKSNFEIEKVSCPKEIVPIRRVTKDDLIGGISLFNGQILAQTSSRRHSTHISLIKYDAPYFGVSGTTSVYNPKTIKGQSSSSHIYVENGQGDSTNKIVAGWHVSPELYNNDATHIYSYWTHDNFKTGCYNILCSGFVQTDRSYYLGARVAQTSTYGGIMVELPISLFQDEKTKNWWLTVANKNIGYFPASLFTNLATGGLVGLGGQTATHVGVPSPSMGSGHFPDDDFVHTCYFRNVAYQNASRHFSGPPEYLIEKFNDAPKNCYQIRYNDDFPSPIGHALQFGGPGGNCDN